MWFAHVCAHTCVYTHTHTHTSCFMALLKRTGCRFPRGIMFSGKTQKQMVFIKEHPLSTQPDYEQINLSCFTRAFQGL